MRCCHIAVCSFIPPHLLQALAERGNERQREQAIHDLELSAQIRGERQAFAGVKAALPTGTKRRAVYDAQHLRDLPGRLIRGESGKPSKDDAVNEAFDGAGATYDFYDKVFDRSSVDGRGMRLESSVHFARAYSNAMWNGQQMIYGDGDGKLFMRFTRSLEVIGHELTHGVTQFSAGLVYRDEPGALNESFSDVFGILVKQFTLKQTAAKADWLIGADLLGPRFHGAAVRSMKAPGTAYDDKLLGKDPQPGHMRHYVHVRADNGGVHVNSGIPNHAFYLLATALGGKAWETAGRIWYTTLTAKLRATATFQECADATWQVAGELHGRNSEPQHAVAAAWKGVGIEVTAAAPRMPIKSQTVAFEAPAPAAEVPTDFHPRRVAK